MTPDTSYLEPNFYKPKDKFAHKSHFEHSSNAKSEKPSTETDKDRSIKLRNLLYMSRRLGMSPAEVQSLPYPVLRCKLRSVEKHDSNTDNRKSLFERWKKLNELRWRMYEEQCEYDEKTGDGRESIWHILSVSVNAIEDALCLDAIRGECKRFPSPMNFLDERVCGGAQQQQSSYYHLTGLRSILKRSSRVDFNQSAERRRAKARSRHIGFLPHQPESRRHIGTQTTYTIGTLGAAVAAMVDTTQHLESTYTERDRKLMELSKVPTKKADDMTPRMRSPAGNFDVKINLKMPKQKSALNDKEKEEEETECELDTSKTEPTKSESSGLKISIKREGLSANSSSSSTAYHSCSSKESVPKDGKYYVLRSMDSPLTVDYSYNLIL